jgi:hypothetical protein
VPLIKFLGKRSLITKDKAPSTASASPAAAVKVDSQKDATIATIAPVEGMDSYNYAWMGRPALSDAEMDAIESGGASVSL